MRVDIPNVPVNYELDDFYIHESFYTNKRLGICYSNELYALNVTASLNIFILI